MGTIKGKIGGTSGIHGHINTAKTKPLPYYDGEYAITPTFDRQALHTKQKSMSDDVTIEKITTLEVDNEAGGVTYIFGA